jgi:hypothetical protein
MVKEKQKLDTGFEEKVTDSRAGMSRHNQDVEEVTNVTNYPTVIHTQQTKSVSYLDRVLKTDFHMFGDKDKFERMINLADKPLVECVVEYTKYKAALKQKSVVLKCKMLLKHLLNIQKENDITVYPIVVGVLFMEQFESYLIKQGLALNTIYNICACMRTIIKWSAMYGAKLSDDIDSYKLRVQDAKPKVTLSLEEISRIYWFDINTLPFRPQKKRTLKKVRDHFVLSCFLGQRYSDTKRIEKSNFVGVQNDIFKIIQQKTGNKAVVQFDKIYDEYPYLVHKILEEYNYTAPYTGHISNFNRYLHEFLRYVGMDDEVKYEYRVKGIIVQKEFKKYQLISSHCSRRTFITNAVKRGVHTQQIKRASGHTTDKSFGKYVIWKDE